MDCHRPGSRVIPESIDAERTAELFELLSFGLRMGLIGVNSHVFTTKDYTDFIIDILRPNGEEGRMAYDAVVISAHRRMRIIFGNIITAAFWKIRADLKGDRPKFIIRLRMFC